MVEVVFYETENGKCQLKDYLNSLEPKLLAKTLRTIDLLENNGINLHRPYSESLSEGLFELRTIQGNNITRIFYFFYFENKVVLTNGFTKKTQKIPRSEIKLAKKYKKDYERRNRNEHI